MDVDELNRIVAYVRYCILRATNQAGSGHPTSSLSATELMTGLLFGGTFRYDPDRPDHPNNDRLIFSKGHASPLLYALWAAAGRLSLDDVLTYRQFGSSLEGHPTVSFRYAEAATGSLGQGLAIGVGMALNAKYLDKLPYRTYVLLGDSEMAEGSQWESIQIAAHYRLSNLTGVLDVNRLGQRGETMYGYDLDAYDRRLQAFGWQTIRIDGHSLPEVIAAYESAANVSDKPVMVIAKTVKGRGVPSVENANGWHGKALGEDALKEASQLWGTLDESVRGTIARPQEIRPAEPQTVEAGPVEFSPGDKVATRDAYGAALSYALATHPNLVALDGEVSNSTRADRFAEKHPDRFFEMYVAEQNMVGTALGLARRGKIPFVSTFAAFLTRAFDQIRMSPYSEANIKFIGSHAGVSIGADGPSQMGLEDLAMFRTLLGSVVLYPSDAVAAARLVHTAAEHEGIVYLRLTRSKTPVIYGHEETFPIGGAKTLRSSETDALTVVSAGYTLHEALAAYDELKDQDIVIRVIDAYSVKPLDVETLKRAGAETGGVLVVEDHYAQGGLGEAVFHELAGTGVPLYHLAVTKKPRSGPTEDQLDHQGISRRGIIARIKQMLSIVTA